MAKLKFCWCKWVASIIFIPKYLVFLLKVLVNHLKPVFGRASKPLHESTKRVEIHKTKGYGIESTGGKKYCYCIYLRTYIHVSFQFALLAFGKLALETTNAPPCLVNRYHLANLSSAKSKLVLWKLMDLHQILANLIVSIGQAEVFNSCWLGSFSINWLFRAFR